MNLHQVVRSIQFTYQPLIARWPLGGKLTLFLACLGAAWLAAFQLPTGAFAAGLTPESQRTLFLLLVAVLLWVTEAIPPFAVSLLVVGYQIFVLGRAAAGGEALEKYTRSWSSPVMWILLGGFFLSMALSRSAWVRMASVRVVSIGRDRPARLLLALMVLTAVLSMFMSNTASTSLMIGVMLPVLSRVVSKPEEVRPFLLAIPVAASLGGMGTIIGSTPNAIAYAYLRHSGEYLSFVRWAAIGIPIVGVLVCLVWGFLCWVYHPLPALRFDGPLGDGDAVDEPPRARTLSPRDQWIVLGTLAATSTLWIFSTQYQISVAEASFVPIIFLTLTGIIRSSDIREIPWDTFLLVMGGLSLGDSLAESGLARHIAGSIQVSGEVPFLGVLVFAGFSVVFSNFMSNTAAAAILIPLANEVVPGHPLRVTLIIALAASAATLLPISTPPNAIAASTGYVRTRDFLKTGGLLILVAPFLLTLFIWLFADRAPQ